MKLFTFIIVALIGSISFGQLAIGIPNVTNNSVILEFGNDGNKGLILPYTEAEIANAPNGTFIFDTSVNRVKVRIANNWVDLSNQNGASNLADQNVHTENSESGIVIGANTSNADGVLVLDATDQAMVLPIVDNFTDIVNPSPGMIVYVRTNKRLAVFNGTKWTFWKSANQ